MTNRRNFIKRTSAISAVTILSPSIAFGSKANSAIRMGIIGCGGRGTGVISSMLEHTNISIIAMADLFEDKLHNSRITFDEKNAKKGFPKIQKSNTYTGPEAYLGLLENNDVDAVLISSPAYTHPEFLEAAVAAGKHVYCEKPIAPDVEGCKRVERVGNRIKGKLSIVVGFQIRHASPYVEMVRRIHRGDIGEIMSGELHYLSSGVPIKDRDGISFDEARIRNQYHFRALSGGILLDQGIHMLDVCNWALKSHPKNAIGIGGKKGTPDFGDTWNNFQILYRYENNINVSLHSTQIGPKFGDVCARFIGSKGMAEAHYSGGVFINGENQWDSGVQRCKTKELTQEQRRAGVFLSSLHDADANKEIHFIKSIETGNYLNETYSGVESTLSAIMGRDAATSNKLLSWDETYFSNSKLDPKLNLSQFNR
ncbi:MAG: Gfo/Idh/MocA family oxidoreductase [Bacteroidales bacterium]|nr:Gfo/Idh/MocA family oxidoreductase [Bacteroidales bacterium]